MSAATDLCKHGYAVRDDDPSVQACIDRDQAAATTLRVTCWSCGKKIKPDKADRALCAECAYGGYFGGS